MKIAEKFNKELNVFETCYIPDGAVLTRFNMEDAVICAQCGEALTFGESYTSMEIYSRSGFGYAVCDRCHRQERRRRLDGKQLTPSREIQRIVEKRGLHND